MDLETVMGAVAAYLLIGMFFAFVYRAAAANEAMAFFGAQGDGTFAQDLFFSFTTLTTTGYGNLVPATNPGQSFRACGDVDWAALPRYGCRPGHQPVPTGEKGVDSLPRIRARKVLTTLLPTVTPDVESCLMASNQQHRAATIGLVGRPAQKASGS